MFLNVLKLNTFFQTILNLILFDKSEPLHTHTLILLLNCRKKKQLLPINKFYHKLINQDINNEYYYRATIAWNNFQCRNNWEYALNYLRSDCLTLTDFLKLSEMLPWTYSNYILHNIIQLSGLVGIQYQKFTGVK